MGIKKGTKLTSNPKNLTLKFRLDSETKRMLDAITEATGKSASEVIRSGIAEMFRATFKG